MLLSYHHQAAAIPSVHGRSYVQPSRPILPIAEWDYTSPRLVQETWDLGRRDGETFMRQQTPRAQLSARREASAQRAS